MPANQGLRPLSFMVNLHPDVFYCSQTLVVCGSIIVHVNEK